MIIFVNYPYSEQENLHSKNSYAGSLVILNL